MGDNERENHRHAEAPDFKDEPQVELEVGGVADADDQVGTRLVVEPAEDYVTGDLLIDAERVETVGARQIEHAKLPAGWRRELSFLAVDRDAGIVGDFLPAAGEEIEQCRLATVRFAEQGEAQGCRGGAHGAVSHTGVTSTRSASKRRRANMVSPTRTASGSPPG